MEGNKPVNESRRRILAGILGLGATALIPKKVEAGKVAGWTTETASEAVAQDDEKLKKQIEILVGKILKDHGVIVRYDYGTINARDQFGNTVEIESLKDMGLVLQFLEKIKCYLSYFPPVYFKERKDALMCITLGVNIKNSLKGQSFWGAEKVTDLIASSDERDSFYIDVTRFLPKKEDVFKFDIYDFDAFVFHEIIHNIFPLHKLTKKIWQVEIMGQLVEMGLGQDDVVATINKNVYIPRFRNHPDYKGDRQYGFARNYGKESHFEDFCTVYEILMSAISNKNLDRNFSDDKMALYGGDVLLKAKVEAAKAILLQALDLDPDYWEGYASRTVYRNGDDIDPMRTSEEWMKYWKKKGKL